MDTIAKNRVRRYKKHRKIKDYSSVGQLAAKTVAGTILAIYCLTLLVPVIWLIYSSFKTDMDYINNIWNLPKIWTLDNYTNVLDKLAIRRVKSDGIYEFGIGTMLFTSFYYALLPAAIGAFANVVFGYVLSKFRFPGNKFIYNLGIILMITPIYGTGAAGLKIAKMLGTYDNMPANIILSYQGGFSGINFLLIYGAFKTISWSYAEAAQIDGASNLQIFTKVMFPMIAPTYICLVAMGFLAGWNSYEQFLLFFPSYANLAYGVYYFQQYAQYYNATGTEVLAGFVVCMIPSVIVYFFADRFVMSKFTVGGLKG